MPHQTPRTRSQLIPAVLIAVGLTLTVMIPKTLFNGLPNAPATTRSAATHTLELDGESTVEFTPPAGWRRPKKESDNDVEFTSPQGDLTVHVWAGDNVLNFSNSAKRLVLQRYRRGLAINYDGTQTSNKNGFNGRVCEVIDVRQQASGSCAVLGDHDVIVLVYALSTHATNPHDEPAGKDIVNDIVSSLKLTTVSREDRDDD